VHSGELIAQRYRLEEPIGAGGMGTVWLATDTTLHRVVALKVSSESRREGVGGAKLMHPNVIAVFDVTKADDGMDWLVMEYLPSRSLRKIRDDDGPLPPADVARIGAQIAAALAHLHGKNMVHRDVTPANVLVSRDRLAKLTDFGIATWHSETQTEDPKTGGGTPGFQAPEVVRGNRATPSSDVYSLGATLLTALEGYPSADAGPAAPLGTVLTGLMHRDPERRPTAEEAQRLLVGVAGPKTTHRGRWLAVAAVVVAVALVLWWVNPFGSGSGAPDATAGTSAAPPKLTALMGDPRTADPCALTYATALSGFGEVTTSDDYGAFNRCDAFVYLTKDHQDMVDVQVELDTGQQDPSAPVQRTGTIGIQRLPAEQGDCTRILLLPGDYQVIIDAQEDGDERVDLCGMAEAITSSALVALNHGQIPRRALPPASLAGQNACTLLDTPTVTTALGKGSVRQEPGLANWECDWSYTGPILVKVIFDRTTAGTSDGDGTHVRLGRYAAVVQPQGYGDTDCLVTLVYRNYVDHTGESTDEDVLVDVDDSQRTPRQLCAPAQRLATTVARRLPH
jgi:hypothetical protein